MLGKRLNLLDMDIEELNIVKTIEAHLYTTCLYMQQIIIIQNNDFDNIDHIFDTSNIHREIHIESNELTSILALRFQMVEDINSEE